MKDLYKTLGVAEDADDATIKKTYRKLAKEFHPDVTGNDKKKTERFKEINEAYAVLGDAQKRKEYDRLKHAPVRPTACRRGSTRTPSRKPSGAGAAGTFSSAAMSIWGTSSRTCSAEPVAAGGAGRTRGRGHAPASGAAPTWPGKSPEISFAEAALGTDKKIRTGSGSTVEVSDPRRGRDRRPATRRWPGRPGPRQRRRAGRPLPRNRGTPDPHLQRTGDDVEVALPSASARRCSAPRWTSRLWRVRSPSRCPRAPRAAPSSGYVAGASSVGTAPGAINICRIEIVVPS